MKDGRRVEANEGVSMTRSGLFVDLENMNAELEQGVGGEVVSFRCMPASVCGVEPQVVVKRGELS